MAKSILPYNAVKNQLQTKEKIKNDFTRSLILSLTTKIFYTAFRLKIAQDGAFVLNSEKQNNLPSISVNGYKAADGGIRYIIEIDNFKGTPFKIFWDGKFDDPAKKVKSKIYLNIENFNVVDSLDEFVLFEMGIVSVLQKYENEAVIEISKLQNKEIENDD
jgi:hypothetical protein